MKRVGHKGADALVPGNTPASFEAAVTAGVDMIEFDVLPTPDGRLVLAHDPADSERRRPLTLDEGLDHLAGTAYSGLEFDVDLKARGYEQAVVDGLRERGLIERCLVSSTYPESLARVGTLEPGLRRGWSVPRVRRDYTRTVLAPGAYAFVRLVRLRLPRQAAAMLREGRCEALMAHWLLVTPRLVEAVQGAGGELYVWTVDDRRRVERLEAMGVDGIITNDPRLFTPRAAVS